MEKSWMDEVVMRERIGSSARGRSYRAWYAGGQECVLRIWEEPFICRGLLARVTRQLENGGWPEGVLPVMASAFDQVPAIRLTPALCDETAEGCSRSRSLQQRGMPLPLASAMQVASGLGRALASMHQRGVAHGNLKPENVLFDELDRLMLTDWAMGHWSGDGERLDGEVLLHQAPEQRTNAVSYEIGGMKWDVFAFGVLVVRMFTGDFPRCDSQTSAWSAATRSSCGGPTDGVGADPACVWPEAVLEGLPAFARPIIARCLAPDPTDRPDSMIEVMTRWDERLQEGKGVARPPLPRSDPAQAAGGDLAPEGRISAPRRDAMCASPRGARSALGVWKFLGLCSTCIAMVLGGVALREYAERTDGMLRLQREQTAHRDQLRTLESAREEAATAEARSRGALDRMRQDWQRERAGWSARLAVSQEWNDQLFVWAMEQGRRDLPVLDGREIRLKRLEQQEQEFLLHTKDAPEWAEERARAMLRLAEISLSLGDEPAASHRLVEAVDAMADAPLDADMRFRVATNRLLLARLKHNTQAADVLPAWEAARNDLASCADSDVNPVRRSLWNAVLDVHEAMALSRAGQETRAVEQMIGAVRALNRLIDEHAEAAVWRSELAGCSLSSATILDGVGRVSDAREARELARKELTLLLERDPSHPYARLELAGCLGAMAEAALLSGDTARAESLSLEAVAHLDEVLESQPGCVQARVRRAVQVALRSGILRDRGLRVDAMIHLEEALRWLENTHASAQEQPLVSYRLALLLWQKARMLGAEGKRVEERELLTRARSMLKEWKAVSSRIGPPRESVSYAAACVTGDLGHALQLAGDRDAAREAFRDALSVWESLSGARPKDETYLEGLVWCRQRVQDLE